MAEVMKVNVPVEATNGEALERCLACEAVVNSADGADNALPLFRLSIAPIKKLGRWPICQGVSSNGNRAQNAKGNYIMISPCLPRPRKRGSAPGFRPNHSGRRVGLQLFQSHKLQSRSVRRVKVYWGSNTSLQRFMPANHAKAPAVSLF